MLAVAAALAGVVAARVLVEGRAELAEGERALAAGDQEGALAHLRRAARWHLPGSPYPARAMDRLEALGDAAERRGELRLARRAREAVRGAILSTRSLYTPEAARLPPTNRKIAELLAREEGPAADPGQSEAGRAAFHLALLERDPLPDVAWSLCAVLGFAVFVLGVAAFCWRAITPADTLDRRAALWSGAVLLVGLSCFVIGLMKA